MTNRQEFSGPGRVGLCLIAALTFIPVAHSGDRDTPDKPASVSGVTAPLVDPSAYRIGAGDVLQVSVWKEPDASAAEVVVRYDGRISVPLVREIEVQGLTPAQLENLLVAKLMPFINAPEVTVVVKAVNSKKIYMVGAVKKEGPLPMHAPLTILRAINEAGGLTDFAKQKKIYVLRVENGKQVRLPFDYQAVLRGQRVEQDIVLLPDDTVVVPR